MTRLERLTKGDQPSPMISENTRRRLAMASLRRQREQHHRREVTRLMEMQTREAKEGF